MDMQTRDILSDFGVSPKTAHFPWVLQVTKGKKTFRIEVSKTTNQNAQWHADAYRKTGQSWKPIELEVDERSKSSAIRQALDLLGF